MNKNKTFFSSVLCAVKGLLKAFKAERNFLVYFIILIITVLINIYLQVSITEIMILFICVCGVFSVECINTAIEKLCDRVTDEYCEIIKFAKDVSASAVLCWGIAYFGIEFILIGVKLFA